MQSSRNLAIKICYFFIGQGSPSLPLLHRIKLWNFRMLRQATVCTAYIPAVLPKVTLLFSSREMITFSKLQGERLSRLLFIWMLCFCPWYRSTKQSPYSQPPISHFLHNYTLPSIFNIRLPSDFFPLPIHLFSLWNFGSTHYSLFLTL